MQKKNLWQNRNRWKIFTQQQISYLIAIGTLLLLSVLMAFLGFGMVMTSTPSLLRLLSTPSPASLLSSCFPSTRTVLPSTWTLSSSGLYPDVSRCTSTLLSSSLCLIVLQSCFRSNIDPKLPVNGAGGFIIQSFGKSESLEPWVLRVRALLILDSICFRLSSKLCLACLKKSSLVLSRDLSVPLKKGSSRKGCLRVIGTCRSLALLLPLSLRSSFLSTTISRPLLELLVPEALLSLFSLALIALVIVSLALLVFLDLPALERLLLLLCISPGPSKLSTRPSFLMSWLFFSLEDTSSVFLSALLLTWSTWMGVLPLSTSSILCSLGIVITITPSWLRLDTMSSFFTFWGRPNLRLNCLLTITSPL